MSKERYTEHTFAWGLPNGDSVTKSNYNLADIETKYIPIQTEIISDNKDKTIAKLQQRIAELEEQLKNAIRFKTPQVERFAVVQYIHWEKKPYKIVNCFDAYKDENMKTRYCFYGVPSANFKVIEICDTKEEAEAKLKEIKGEQK